MARLGIVAGERVAAEVVGQVPPHGVDVVHAALGVVVLDEHPLALDPIVVRLAALGAARPKEAQSVELPVDQARLLVGELVGQTREIAAEQLAQDRGLAGIERRTGMPFGSAVKLKASR